MSKIMERYRLAVNEARLLAEFPAFFQSFDEMLTELVQNAYRSGSTSIQIALNYDTRELTVEDDGPGVADPAQLLTAGQSSWSEAVVDPAGLGFFALLGLVQEVAITSRTADQAWQATVTDTCFDGSAIHPVVIPSNGHTGLRLHAQLKESVKLPVALHYPEDSRTFTMPSFRQFYPVTVTLTTVREGATATRVLPAPSLDGPALDTPVGRVVRSLHTDSRPAVHWIWEHRQLTHTNSIGDLIEAISAHPDGAFVVAGLRTTDLWVIIDTATQHIRPKLPDRREVIKDAGYHATIDALARALVEAAQVDSIRTQLATLDLPDVIPNFNAVSDRLAALDWPAFFRWQPEALLTLAGYHACSYTNYREVDIYYVDDEGWDCSSAQHTVWARQALPVARQALADALCQEGLWAYVSPHPDPITVRFVHYQGLDDPPFVFGFADAIVVERAGQPIGTLTRWLHDGEDLMWDSCMEGLVFDGHAPDHTPVAVWTRPPRSIITAWHHRDLADEMSAVKLAIYHEDSSAFWDYLVDNGSDEIDDGKIAETVIDALVMAFAADDAYDQQRWRSLQSVGAQWDVVTIAFRELSRVATQSQTQYPELATLVEPLLILARQAEKTPWAIDAFKPALAEDSE